MSIEDKVERVVNLPVTFEQVFVEEGNLHSVIDIVNPTTGRSAVYGQTLDQMRERYPTAVIMPYAEWAQQKAATQDTPVEWIQTTAREYNDMLNILPPAYWDGRGFLVGEPHDHHALSGAPRYQGYREVGSEPHYRRWFKSSRPMTVAEFRKLP